MTREIILKDWKGMTDKQANLVISVAMIRKLYAGIRKDSHSAILVKAKKGEYEFSDDTGLRQY